MARTNEPNIEFDPRHRIAGAIILVTVAVIILPLILDERHAPAPVEPDRAAHVSTPEPASGAADQDTKSSRVVVRKLSERVPTATAPTDATTKDSKQENQTRVVVKQLAPAKSQSEIPKVASDSSSKPVPVKKTEPTKTATTQAVTKPHWAVQVGTFSNPGNVRRLSKQLKERGYSVMFKDVNLKQGTAVRVRVGPYTSRASADRAQGKIIKDIGVKGVVVAGP